MWTILLLLLFFVIFHKSFSEKYFINDRIIKLLHDAFKEGIDCDFIFKIILNMDLAVYSEYFA